MRTSLHSNPINYWAHVIDIPGARRLRKVTRYRMMEYCFDCELRTRIITGIEEILASSAGYLAERPVAWFV